MTRRARVGLSPSLFPFLAVLVCTLGTLILLLALVAQNATSSAKQQAEAKKAASQIATDTENAEAQPTSQVVQRMLQEGDFRVAQLVSFRNSQTADLEERRDKITHLDDHVRRIREELAQLNREVELATSESPLTKIDETRVSELKAKLASEQELLEELRESAQSKKPRVVIVPHKGPNGTDRRPVYLECTASGITIWPESSRIEIKELMAAESNSNPLDAALRTVRLYVMQNYGDTIPPYPLLVVRPDGIETYGAARQAMKDWDDQFGYELVPADVDLAYANPDSQLKQKVDVAIREAVAKQASISSAAGIALGRGGSGNGSGSRVRPLSAAELDRAGRSGGYSDTPDRSLQQRNYSGSTNYGSSGNADTAAARRLDEHIQNAAQEIAKNGSSNFEMPSLLSNQSPSGTPGAPGTGPAGTGPAGTDSAASLGQGTGLETQSSPNSFDKSLTKADGTAGDGTGFQMPGTDSLAGSSKTGTTGEGSPDGKPGEATNPNDKNNSSTTPSEKSGTGSTASNSDPQVVSKDQSAGTYAKGSNQGAGDSGTQMQGGGSPTQQSSSVAGAQASARGSADESQGTPSVSVSNNVANQSARKSIQRKGKDWALPDNVSGLNGTAVIRTIRVVCYSDRLVLLPPASGGATEIFGFSDGQIDRATLELASAVRDRIEAWGPSLPGGRWQPRLEVEVTRDGTARFSQLQSLLNGSGVDVIGKPTP